MPKEVVSAWRKQVYCIFMCYFLHVQFTCSWMCEGVLAKITPSVSLVLSKRVTPRSRVSTLLQMEWMTWTGNTASAQCGWWRCSKTESQLGLCSSHNTQNKYDFHAGLKKKTYFYLGSALKTGFVSRFHAGLCFNLQISVDECQYKRKNI